jgi:hypothetical protein
MLSRDLGPRILQPFYEAKARLDENPPIKLDLKAELTGGIQRLTVKVLNDGLKLGAKVKLWTRAPGGDWSTQLESVRPEGFTFEAAGDTVEYYAQLFSPNDGLLLEHGSSEAPFKAEPPPPEPVAVPVMVVQQAPVARPLSTVRKIAIATGAVGVASLGGALAAGIVSRSARSEVENPQRDEAGRLIGMTAERAHELEQRTVNSALAANVLLGVGAGLVAAGVVLFIADPGGGAQVALAPAPGGVVIAGSF